MFDNGTTVFFAVFMSLWAVFFLGINTINQSINLSFFVENNNETNSDCDEITRKENGNFQNNVKIK